jgi:hypothetical protein
VLATASAKEAMLTEVGFSGRIHLLLSEVLMADIMGPDLAAAMKERRPVMRGDADVAFIRMAGFCF